MEYAHGGDIWSFEAEYHRKPIDFSSNISPLGMPDSVRAALRAAAEDGDIYPDPLCRELRAAIGAKTGVPADCIVCGNGAADLIWRIVWAVKPKNAVLPVPAFSEYGAALASVGCEIFRYYLDENADFDLDSGILTAIDDGTDIVFLCNPNNPTGRLIEPTLLDEILRRCREVGALTVIDESFGGFAENYTSTVSKLGDNLIVLNSMTKLYAMAGVRLGWCACDCELAGRIAGTGQPWPVSVFAQRAGIAALNEDKYTNDVIKYTTAERLWMEEGLRGAGLRVISGSADFLLFYTKKSILRGLAKCGIIIRECSGFDGLGQGWYRTSIRRHDENTLLIRAVREALENG